MAYAPQPMKLEFWAAVVMVAVICAVIYVAYFM